MSKEFGSVGDKISGEVRASGIFVPDGILIKGEWLFEARDPNGDLLWRDGFDNKIVNVGLSHMLSVTLERSPSPDPAQVATWYVGIFDAVSSPPVAAGDTMSSHSGWTEVTAYTEGVRQTFVDGGESGQSLDNSASKATFSINAGSTTIDGGFLTSDNTKSGTSGTLFSAGEFSGGQKVLGNGDTLDVQITYSISSST